MGEGKRGSYFLHRGSYILRAGIPKVVGSNPTVVRHIFKLTPVWIYTQSNITSIIVQ
jgi:hypothetical protein